MVRMEEIERHKLVKMMFIFINFIDMEMKPMELSLNN